MVAFLLLQICLRQLCITGGNGRSQQGPRQIEAAFACLQDFLSASISFWPLAIAAAMLPMAWAHQSMAMKSTAKLRPSSPGC